MTVDPAPAASAPVDPAPAGDVRAGRPLRTFALGISTRTICGVRDHAALLAQALGRENCPCSLHWLDRGEQSLRGTRAEVRAWTDGLAGELAGAHADVALLHYSVFSFAYRGLPLFTHPTLAAVRASRTPLVTILHEFVYPWRRDGLRGTAWAASQRALLVDVMRSSDAVVTTTDFQAEWLASRLWLAKRRTAVAPVFSNLPPALAAAEVAAPAHPAPTHTAGPRAGRAGLGRPPDRDVATVGLFGYAYGEQTVSLIAGALRLLQDRGVRLRLLLLGGPGGATPAADRWLAAARGAALAQEPSFTGLLPAQELSDTLAACDVLLFADPLGPNSRKTTLAASLASGRPVVALDGPRRWHALDDAGAAKIVAPEPRALAGAVASLLADERLRDALADRGRTFAQRRMSVASSARAIAELLGEVVSQPR